MADVPEGGDALTVTVANSGSLDRAARLCAPPSVASSASGTEPLAIGGSLNSASAWPTAVAIP